MKHYFSQIYHLARGKLAKQTGIVFLSQALQAVLGFATNIVLLRTLPIEDYGYFSIFVSTFMLLAGLAHWGWTESFVRFGASHVHKENYDQVESFFRRRIFLLAGFTTALLLAASPILAQKVYQKPELTIIIAAAGVTGFLTCIFSFEINRVRIFEKFWLYFSVNVTGSLFRLIAVCALFMVGKSAIPGVSLTYLLSPLLLIGIIWAFLPPRRPPAIASLPFEKEAKRFNRWLLVSIFSTTIFTNIDVHVLAYFYPSEVVAQLGAVSRLTLPITILVTSLSTTMLPRLSRNANDPDFFLYYLRKLKLVLPFSILGFAIMGAAVIPLLSRLAGSQYNGLEPLIALQLISILIVLLTNPLGLLVIAEGRTKTLAFMNLAQLIIGIGLHFFLVPKLGAVGSICASIGINAIGMITTIFLIRRRLFN